MRWYWIDRFLEFVSGSHAVTVKNVSLVEEQMENYVPGHPLMPGSLNIEGFAQTGGLLVGEHRGFAGEERGEEAHVVGVVGHDQEVERA